MSRRPSFFIPPPPRFLLRHLSRQNFQLLPVQHLVIHHSQNQRLRRSPAKPVNNILHRPHRNVLPALRSTVNESPPLNGVRHVTFLLNPPQHGANGGLLHRTHASQRLAASLRSARPARPHVIHHQLFQLAQILQSFRFRVSH